MRNSILGISLLVFLFATCITALAEGKQTNAGPPMMDFNGDGFADIAIPVPFEDVEGKKEGGAVNIQYGNATGFRTAGNLFITLKTMGFGIVAFDYFGWDGVAADVNRDGFTDLIVGSPGRNSRNGAVYVIPGSRTGLLPKQSIELSLDSENASNILNQQDSGDLLGTCIAAGDFNGDGTIDVAAGATGVNAGSKEDVGAIAFFTQINNGLLKNSVNRTLLANAVITPDSPNIKGVGQVDEGFGFRCESGFYNSDNIADAVVSTLRPITGTSAKGSVHILFGSSALNFQSNRVIQGRDSGGAFGSSLITDGSVTPNRLFVGAPRANNAKGKVYSVTNAASVKLLFTGQNNGDFSGWSVAAASAEQNGAVYLAIGSPGYDLPSSAMRNSSTASKQNTDVGQAQVLKIDPRTGLLSLVGSCLPSNDTKLLGYQMAAWLNGDGTIAVEAGAPGTTVTSRPDAGAVCRIKIDPNTGLLSLVGSVHQQTPGVKDTAESGDRFGDSRIRSIYLPIVQK